MTKTQITYDRTTAQYKVCGITTETDAQIIDFCDNNNFGGRVNRNGDTAMVYVYID